MPETGGTLEVRKLNPNGVALVRRLGLVAGGAYILARVVRLAARPPGGQSGVWKDPNVVMKRRKLLGDPAGTTRPRRGVMLRSFKR